MPSEIDLRRSGVLARAMLTGGAVVAALSSVLLVAALMYPIGFGGHLPGPDRPRQVSLLAPPQTDTDALVGKMTGRRVLRPSQIQAAVKDDGRAERLAKALRLQGVVRMGQDYVAYVQIDRQGVKGIRRGETILGFAVEKVEPGKVTLSLKGVQVLLSH